MLKANIGLSRKITRDFNSTGYSVNIEGEIIATPDDPDGVLGRIQELFGLANEAVDREIDRDQGEAAIGRRDEELQATPEPARNYNYGKPTPGNSPQPAAAMSTGSGQANDKITDKQSRFLTSLAKRYGLSNVQLDGEVERIVGRQTKIFELTKKEAGRVIDALTENSRTNAR